MEEQGEGGIIVNLYTTLERSQGALSKEDREAGKGRN